MAEQFRPSQAFLAAHPNFAKAYATGDPAIWRRWLNSHPKAAADARAEMARQQSGSTSTTPSPDAQANQNLADAINRQLDQQATDAVQARDNAYETLKARFESYGLGSLAPKILEFTQQGFSDDTVTLKLQETEEYKTRFAANEARKKAGLRVLSPAEYIQTESAYRDAMRAAGLPAGFYDSADDFKNFLERDVSPAEVQGRVAAYVQAAKNTDPAYRQMISDTFGVGLTDGDIAAFMLDPARALPVLEKRVNAFGVADAARVQGLAYSADRANTLSELGVSAEQARQGFAEVAGMLPAYRRAGAAFGESYDQTTAEDEALLGLASAKRKREQIEGAFTGYNAGSSRASKGALKRDDSGSY